MRNSIRKTKKRFPPLLAASALLAGGFGAFVLLTGGTADAATAACPAGVGPTGQPAGTACTITGTLILTSGTLDLTAPPAVGWAPTISGVDQFAADPTAADQTYTVDDATGTAPGWNVTASATPFTVATLVTGSAPVGTTLGTAGAVTPTFSTNGSLGLATDTTAPDANCAGTSTCTLPTNNLAATGYPVTITTGQAGTGTTPATIYDAAAGTGLGTVVIGNNGVTGTNPVGWWLNVPSNTLQGTYVSTISLQLNAGP
jgi:hypothetical protein